MNRRRRKSWDQICVVCNENRAIWALQDSKQVRCRPNYCDGCIELLRHKPRGIEYQKTYTKEECKREIRRCLHGDSVVLLNKWAHKLQVAEKELFKRYSYDRSPLVFLTYFYLTKLWPNPFDAVKDSLWFDEFMDEIEEVDRKLNENESAYDYYTNVNKMALRYYQSYREYEKTVEKMNMELLIVSNLRQF